MARERIGRKAEILLGQKIERLRLAKKITRMQLGEAINATERQIAKYEGGDMVPLPVLEEIADALGQPIPKKIIRRISFLRKLERETSAEQEELESLYAEAFLLAEE